jgi:hypothetical protein
MSRSCHGHTSSTLVASGKGKRELHRFGCKRSASAGLPPRSAAFRLNAVDEARSRSETAIRRNGAARADSVEAAHNPEVAGSNPAPRYEKPRSREAFHLRVSSIRSDRNEHGLAGGRLLFDPGDVAVAQERDHDDERRERDDGDRSGHLVRPRGSPGAARPNWLADTPEAPRSGNHCNSQLRGFRPNPVPAIGKASETGPFPVLRAAVARFSGYKPSSSHP